MNSAVSGGQSLDPDDWETFRAEAHGALDLMIEHLRTIREGPVWQPPSEQALGASRAPLPRAGKGLAATLEAFRNDVLPYATGNLHPRFMGWIHGAGTPVGMVAEMLAAGLNANCGGRHHIGIEIERQVTRWMAELFCFPEDASGLFVTGTSMANFLAVLIAREKALGPSARATGIESSSLTGYTSDQAHGCIKRAFEMAGLGANQLRRIASDEAGRIDPRALEEALEADRAAGCQPFLIVGTAGSVDIGAVDPLNQLADICARERVWFHVDGAFGALAQLSPELRPMLVGIERADSLAFDFHKWLHLPYDAGFLLCRDRTAHRAAFADRAPYLSRAPRGLAQGEDWPTDFGPDLSRGFRALKAWMAFNVYGADRLGETIERSCALARFLVARIEASPVFELKAPRALNIVCFGLPGSDGAVESEIVMDLQESGIAAPSTTRINGCTVIRCAIVNHRTTEEDLEIVVAAAEALATQDSSRFKREDLVPVEK